MTLAVKLANNQPKQKKKTKFCVRPLSTLTANTTIALNGTLSYSLPNK